MDSGPLFPAAVGRVLTLGAVLLFAPAMMHGQAPLPAPTSSGPTASPGPVPRPRPDNGTPGPVPMPMPATANPPQPNRAPSGLPPSPPPLPDQRAAEAIGPVKLRNDSIDSVLALLERWTGKTILRPPALPAGSYTLTLENPASREEAILALQTLLNLNSIAVSPLGTRFLKVTPLNLARTESPMFIEGSARDLPPSGQVASKLFTPQFLRVSEFLPQISALLNPGLGAAPVLFEKSNSALITDSVSNLQRIEALLERVDRPFIDQNVTKFYPLHSAKASTMVAQLRTLLSGPLQMQLGAATSFQPDDRTNQVILISDARQQAFFDDLIAKLDVQGDPNTRNEVIFLKNATAKDVATLLSSLVSGRNNAARTAGEAAPARSVNPPGQPAVPNAPATAAVASLPGLDTNQEFSQLLTVLPEDRSNALIVSGTVDDIRLIRELVEKIDVLLAQVRIEVVIAEVTLNDSASSGINALGLNVRANKLVGFSADAGSSAGLTITNGTALTNTNGGVDLAADIGLSTTPRKDNTTILSSPVITTTHNKEGHIFVGEERPVISGFVSDLSGTSTAGSSSIGRTNVNQTRIGIDLLVKPLIGNDGSVQLEITQEVSDVIGTVILDGNEQPVIGQRQTKSFISVKSGEIIVLAGLQRTTRGHTTTRLGPIPIIGDLLGSRKRTDNRTDLLFFLRPHVLTNTPADNVDAYRQVDAGTQSEAIRKLLAPGAEPEKKPKR